MPHPPLSSTRASALRDWVLLLLCNLIWASQYSLVKLVQDESGPLFTTSFPMAIATVVLAPLVLWQRSRSATRTRLTRQDVGAFLLIGLCGQVAAQLGATWGSQRSLASNASVLSLTVPIATALMAHLLLGERMTATRWISFVFATIGVVICSLGDFRAMDLGSSGLLFGNVLIFVAMLGSAFYNVYSKRLLDRYSPLEVLLGSYIVVCVVLVPVTLWFEPDALARAGAFSPRAWVGMGLLAALQYFLSMFIFLRVLTRLDAMQASLSNYMIPVFGLLLAWLLLGERPGMLTWIGGVPVLLSTLLITVYEQRRNTAQSSSHE